MPNPFPNKCLYHPRPKTFFKFFDKATNVEEAFNK